MAERHAHLVGRLYKAGKGFTGSKIYYKRFFVLNGQTLCYYSSREAYEKQERPHKVVDLSGSRVEDCGMLRWNGKELYTISLHFNAFTSDERQTLQMGSRNPEEASRWETALRRALVKASLSEAAALHDASTPSTSSGEAPQNPLAGADEACGGPKSTGAIGGHLPPVLRDVQEVARRGPLTTSASMTSQRFAPFAQPPASSPVAEEASAHSSQSEGPSVLSPPWEGVTWRLNGLENGLRIFEDSDGKAGAGWGSTPCTKVAGRVRAPSHVVFKLVMDLGRSREQWDCTFASGGVLESLDGHTEVVHVELRPMRLAWGGALPSRPRDLVMTRHWRREEDGTYVILFRSTPHERCPPQAGFVRAEVVSGCFTISQLAGDSGAQQCLVLYLLETTPGGWMLPFTGLPRAFQRSMLMSVAGIRDFFEQLSETGAANVETGLPDPLHSLLAGPGGEGEEEDDEEANGSGGEEDASPARRPAFSSEPSLSPPSTPLSVPGSLAGASPASPSGDGVARPLCLSRSLSGAAAASLARNSVAAYEPAPNFAGLPRDAGGSLRYCIWPPPKGSKGLNTWCAPAGHRFVVRSPSYLQDGVKCSAGPPLMSLVAVDWLTAETRIDGICKRPLGVAQRVLLPACNEGLRIFCVNLQVPGSKPYSIIFYFACQGEIAPDSVLGRFWHGSDAFRAPRFKLIPSITEGAWAVQRSVGTKPLIVGNALRTTYHGGGASRFLEVDVDIGSSSVANSVTRFVMVYLKTLVIDLGFLIESKTEAELPERLIGAIRVSRLDPDLAAQAPPV